MQKGDEVDVVVVVEIKLVLSEQFSDEIQILPSRSHHPKNHKQIHYVQILLTTQ